MRLNTIGLIVMLALGTLAAPRTTDAQPPGKVPQIGFVSGSGDPTSPGLPVEAFRHGLRELGYIEGNNILVEYRYIEAKLERIPSFVAELVQRKVDVLVTGNLATIRLAKEATKTMPIVMVTSEDPVATGLVESLARPGGNITGITRITRELSGKRLELLQEVVPGIVRVGVLWNTESPPAAIAFKAYEAATRRLKIPLQSLEIRGPNPDLEGAFRAATTGHASALITVRDAVLNRYQKRIADLAIKHRLLAMYEGHEYVEAGGLMSYSSSDAAQYRRAATYVDKILKGAKPADLPVEQPMKFELVINLKTAKALGLTIPPTLLFQATEVIR